MSSEQTDWVVAYASAIGNLHIREAIPCQDSCIHERFDEHWGIAVVADGAGSAKYSHIGSDFVVRNTLHCFQQALKEVNWDSADALPTEEAWRRIALQNLQIVTQRLRQFAAAKDYKFADLACTVIAVLYAPFGICTVHIGDGRAGYSDTEGWHSLIKPYNGAEANETVFITSNIWTEEGVKEFIETRVVEAPIQAFVLLSDGCERSSFEVNVFDEEAQKYYDPNRPYAKFFEPNLKGLRMLKKEGKSQEAINTLWEGFLKEGTNQFKHETDDKTMVLGARMQPVLSNNEA